jgi:hypothetical protein
VMFCGKQRCVLIVECVFFDDGVWVEVDWYFGGVFCRIVGLVGVGV